MVTTERLRELIDAAPARLLEASTGRTYGATPTTEAFVRCAGSDVAVAENVADHAGNPAPLLAELFALSPELARETVENRARIATLEAEVAKLKGWFFP